MRIRISSLPILGLALATLVCSGCGPEASDEASNPAAAGPTKKPAGEFGTTMVTAKSYVEKVELPGASVQGFERTQLMSKIGGYVKEIKKINDEEVDVGTRVKKGDVLAILDVPELLDQLAEKKALVRQAKSEVEKADAVIKQMQAGIMQREAEVKQANAARVEKNALLSFSQAKKKRIVDLVNQGTIGRDNLDEVTFAVEAAAAAITAAQADIETAEANVKAAQADLEKAKADKSSTEEHVKVAEAISSETQTMLGYANITAPFSGVITKRHIDHGAFVRPATSNSGAMPLFEITRIDMVRVAVSVPNVDTSKIKVGQKTFVHSIGGILGVSIRGSVTRMSHALDPDSRMMGLEVHLKNPLKQPNGDREVTLRPGMYGSVTVIVKEWEDLPVVPSGAIQTDASGQTYVYVVNGERIANRQDVEVAFNDAEFVGLRSGVSPGKTVVSQNASNVKDGQSIPANSK
jgi:HlyD family secretion protein